MGPTWLSKKSSKRKNINRSEALLISIQHTLIQLGCMSERGSAHTSERENSYWRSSFLYLGFTSSIGVHSISEEFAGFSPLWFPPRKIVCVSCPLCFIAVHVILSLKNPNIIMLA